MEDKDNSLTDIIDRPYNSWFSRVLVSDKALYVITSISAVSTFYIGKYMAESDTHTGLATAFGWSCMATLLGFVTLYINHLDK
jgi:choline-glycine betaine transporter